MSLKEYAEREICLAGMSGESWNECRCSHRIMELVIAFAAGEHSGGSAAATLSMLESTGWKQARKGCSPGSTGPVADVVNTFASQDYTNDSNDEFVFTRFLHLARFKPLGPGGNTDPGQFKPTVEFANDVTEYCDMRGSKQIVYQSTRKPGVFSADSGKTWYDLDDPDWAHPLGCTPTPMPRKT